MSKLLDLENPFFAPVWIRVLVVLVTGIWGSVEFYNDAVLWGVIFVGLSAICAWRFYSIDYSTPPEE